VRKCKTGRSSGSIVGIIFSHHPPCRFVFAFGRIFWFERQSEKGSVYIQYAVYCIHIYRHSKQQSLAGMKTDQFMMYKSQQ